MARAEWGPPREGTTGDEADTPSASKTVAIFLSFHALSITSTHSSTRSSFQATSGRPPFAPHSPFRKTIRVAMSCPSSAVAMLAMHLLTPSPPGFLVHLCRPQISLLHRRENTISFALTINQSQTHHRQFVAYERDAINLIRIISVAVCDSFASRLTALKQPASHPFIVPFLPIVDASDSSAFGALIAPMRRECFTQ